MYNKALVSRIYKEFSKFSREADNAINTSATVLNAKDDTKGAELWCSRLSRYFQACHLQPTSQYWFRFQLLCFWSTSWIISPRRQHRVGQKCGPLLSMWGSKVRSRLLALPPAQSWILSPFGEWISWWNIHLSLPLSPPLTQLSADGLESSIRWSRLPCSYLLASACLSPGCCGLHGNIPAEGNLSVSLFLSLTPLLPLPHSFPLYIPLLQEGLMVRVLQWTQSICCGNWLMRLW